MSVWIKRIKEQWREPSLQTGNSLLASPGRHAESKETDVFLLWKKLQQSRCLCSELHTDFQSQWSRLGLFYYFISLADTEPPLNQQPSNKHLSGLDTKDPILILFPTCILVTRVQTWPLNPHHATLDSIPKPVFPQESREGPGIRHPGST